MLLDGTLFKAVKVLTSHGIQTRYQEAVRERAKKRGISVNGELWLLDEAESESFIQVRQNYSFSQKNGSKSGKNGSKSREESAKESKGDESKGDESKSPPTPHGGETDGGPKYRPEWFSRFWALYPRHTKRADAIKAWDKLKPDRALCDVMASAIRAQAQTDQWQRDGGRFIPHPASWLNGRRWEDEVQDGQRQNQDHDKIKTSNPFLRIAMEEEND